MITTKVKSQLAADDFMKSFEISVETHKGEVQLSGFVDTQLAVNRAGKIARGVQRISLVENNLNMKEYASCVRSLKGSAGRSEEEKISPLLLSIIPPNSSNKDRLMASNFGNTVDKSNDGFGLKLAGDFDATSACELIYAIKKLPEDTIKISIHTNGLKSIFDFGLDVFNRKMNPLVSQSRKIVFTGNNASRLCPGNSSRST